MCTEIHASARAQSNVSLARVQGTMEQDAISDTMAALSWLTRFRKHLCVVAMETAHLCQQRDGES